MYRIKADGIIVYDQGQPGIWSVKAPRISQAVNEGGELQFALAPMDSFYDTCLPMETYISVEDYTRNAQGQITSNEEIFYGRVLTRSLPVMNGVVSITCEGALCFLLDAELAADAKSGGSYSHQTQTAEAFLSRCITAYNSEIDNDARRQLTLGTVAHSKKSTSKKYEITTYQTIKDAIETHILEEYGGFIQIRRDQNGTLVLDWFEGYDSVDEKPIRLGENIINQTNKLSGENIYTVLRPLGNNNLTLSEGTLNIFSSDDITNKYGKIVKSVSFSDKKTEAALRTKAQEYIAMLHGMMFGSIELKVVDFHYIDGTFPKLRLGDAYSGLTGFQGTTMTITNREIELENPANDTITLKNPKEMESLYKGYGDTNGSSGGSSSSSSLSGSTSGGFGTVFKHLTETDEELKLHAEKITINAEDILVTSNNYVSLSHRTDGIVGRVESVEGRMTTMEGSAVIQNADTITSVVGRFTLIDTDHDGIADTMSLQNGTALEIDDGNGARMTVGNAITTNAGAIATFQGSALWTQRDNITGVVGQFDVVGEGNNRRVRILNGAGLVLYNGSTEYGVYTDGNLTGGIVIDKINANTTTAKINANRLNITASDFAAIGVYTGETLTGGVIIQKINGNTTSTSIRGDKIDITTNTEYGTISSTVGSHTESINYLNDEVTTTIKGSTLWQNRNTITGVVGEFDIITDPTTGVKRLVVKSGGGLKIKKNNVEYGIYDEGNLDAGIIVSKLSDGTTTTKIKSDYIDFTGYVTTVGLKTSVANITGELDVNAALWAKGGLNVSDELSMQLGSTAYMTTVYADELYVGANDADLSNAIISAVVEGNTLTLTDANGVEVTFNKTVQLVPGWNGATYSVVATMNGEEKRRISVAVQQKLDGTAQYSNFTAEIGTYESGNWVRHGDSIRGDLVVVENGASSYVDVQRYSDNQTIARTSVGSIYTAGATAAGADAVVSDIGTIPIGHSSEYTALNTVTPTSNSPSYCFTVTIGDTVLKRKFTVDCLGRYNAGKDAVVFTGHSWQISGDSNISYWNTVTVTITPKSDNTARTRIITIYMDQDSVFDSSHQKYAYVRVGSSTGSKVAKLLIDATSSYESGWGDAQGKVHFSYDTSSDLTSSITVEYPNATSGTVTPDSVTYTVSADNYYAYINHDGTTVARASHSAYSNGWNLAAGSDYSSAPISGSGTTITVKLPHSGSMSTADTYTYTLENVDNNTVHLKYNEGAGGNGITVATFAHNKYDAGRDMVDFLPDALVHDDNTSGWAHGDTMRVNTYHCKVTSKSDGTVRDHYVRTRMYWIVQENGTMWDASGRATIIVRNGPSDTNDSTSPIIAHLDITAPSGQGSPSYTNGWNAAAAISSAPTAEGSTTSISVHIPRTYSSGDTSYTYDERTYTIKSINNNQVGLYYSTTPVAKLTHNKWNGGLDSVTLTGPTYNSISGAYPNNRTLTVTATPMSDGTIRKVDQLLTLTADNSFSSHVKNVQMRLGGVNGTILAQFAVDATSEYQAGWNAVIITGVTYNNISGDYTDTRTIIFAINNKTDGTTRTREQQLTLTQEDGWSSGHQKAVYVRAGGGTGTRLAKVVVDASTEYNNGALYGWNLARGKVGYAEENTANGNMTVTFPGSSYNSSDPMTYTLSVDGTYAYIKNPAGTTVARVSNTIGKTTGWNYAAGSDYSSTKTTSGTGTSFNVKLPKSGSYATANTYTYELRRPDNYTVNLVYTQGANNTGITVAKLDITSVYEAGKLAGWQAYYDDAADWFSNYSEGGGTYSVWIPRRTPPTGYSGNGTASTCEKWFEYNTGGTHSVTASQLSRQAKASGDSFISGCRKLTGGWSLASQPMYYKFRVICGSSSAWYYFEV